MNTQAETVNIQVKQNLRIVVAVGIFICMFSSNFIGTAFGTTLVTMVKDLKHVTSSAVGLLFTANILMVAIFTPIAANLGNKIGKGRLFYLGALVNIISLVMMFFCHSLVTLVMGRALQGLGGAFIFATGLTLIGDIFPPSERAKWLSGYSIITAAGSSLGPLLAGLMVDFYDWRGIFLIDIPIGVLGLIMVFIALPRIPASDGQGVSFDYLGSLFFGLALVLILGICITGGSLFPWAGLTTAALLVTSIILFVFFIIIEKRAASPILPLDMFRYNVFMVGILCGLLSTLASMIIATYLPTYIQAVMGQTAMLSGTVMSVMAVVSMVIAPVAGQIVAKTGKIKCLTSVSLLCLTVPAFILSMLTPSTNITILFVVAGIIGVASPVIGFVFQVAVQNGLPRDKTALGTGGIQLGTIVGAMLGIAFTGIVMQIIPEVQSSLPFMFRISGIVSIAAILVLLFLKEGKKN